MQRAAVSALLTPGLILPRSAPPVASPQVDVAGVDVSKFDDAYFKSAEKKAKKQVGGGAAGWAARRAVSWILGGGPLSVGQELQGLGTYVAPVFCSPD